MRHMAKRTHINAKTYLFQLNFEKWIKLGVAQLVGHLTNWKNESPIPHQGTGLGCGSWFPVMACTGGNQLIFLSYTDVSLPFFSSISLTLKSISMFKRLRCQPQSYQDYMKKASAKLDVIFENKTHHHWKLKPFLPSIIFNGSLYQCWLQKYFAKTVISLKAKGIFEGWRSGEITKEIGSWSQVNLDSNPSIHDLS